jgi:hypothetical protein
VSKLFDRICTVTIDEKAFKSPPFSIEFTQTAKIGTLMSNVLKLYNPSNDTIKLFESKKIGGKTIYPKILIEAGYKELNGTCTIGEVTDFKVSFGPPDRIIEAKIGDISGKWINGYVNQTYNNMSAKFVLTAMFASVGVLASSIELGQSKSYPSITIRKFSDAVRQICRDTKSEFTFKNGLIRISPITPRLKKAKLLSPTTGLIGKPEKIPSGYKIKTLFIYDIEVGDYVMVESQDLKNSFKITSYKKTFSSFGNAECEFEVIKL